MSHSSECQGKNPLLIVEFSEAYSFRRAFEYLKHTNIEGNLYFRPKEILYNEADSENTILNIIRIKTSDLTRYVYNSDEDYISIGFTISNFCQITKNIGKKDTLLIYILQDDPLVYLRIDGPNSKSSTRNSVYVLRPKNRGEDDELAIFEEGKYSRDWSDPNCTIPMSDFSKMCSSMTSIKCSYVTISGFPHGVKFKGMMEGNITGQIGQFGQCDSSAPKLSFSSSSPINKEISSPELNRDFSDQKTLKLAIRGQEDVKIKVKSNTIKALSKLNNLTHGGVIKIYAEKLNPIKLVCNIGSYGELTIYLDEIEKS